MKASQSPPASAPPKKRKSPSTMNQPATAWPTHAALRVARSALPHTAHRIARSTRPPSSG
jgi:hypothetical protein